MVDFSTPVPKMTEADGGRTAFDTPSGDATSFGPGGLPGDTRADLEAVNTAYKENYRDLCNFADSFLHSRELAQDSVHQAFASTLATVRSGGEIRDLRGFLITCVRNNSLSYLRRSKRESSYSFEEDYMVEGEIGSRQESSAAASFEIDARWKKVKGAIEGLPKNQRFALLMADFQGYSYKEIADQMHRSDNSVRQLIRRGRQRVQTKADMRSDWALIPVPAMEVDRLLARGHVELSPNIFDLLQAKTSQLQTWIGNLLQSGSDNILHPATAVATGAAIVALAAVSPAPPGQPVSSDDGPLAGTVKNAPVLAQGPSDSGTSKSGTTETSSAADSPRSEGGADGPGRGPALEEPPPGKGEGKGDRPAPATPGNGKCGERGCGGENFGGKRGSVSGGSLEGLEPNNVIAAPVTNVGVCGTRVAVNSCISQTNLVPIGLGSGSVSVEIGGSAGSQIGTVGDTTSASDDGGTVNNGSSTEDPSDTSLGSADGNGSISPFSGARRNSTGQFSNN